MTLPYCGEHEHIDWEIAIQCQRNRMGAEIERLRAALKEIQHWNNRTSLSEPRLIAHRALEQKEPKP